MGTSPSLSTKAIILHLPHKKNNKSTWGSPLLGSPQFPAVISLRTRLGVGLELHPTVVSVLRLKRGLCLHGPWGTMPRGSPCLGSLSFSLPAHPSRHPLDASCRPRGREGSWSPGGREFHSFLGIPQLGPGHRSDFRSSHAGPSVPPPSCGAEACLFWV